MTSNTAHHDRAGRIYSQATTPLELVIGPCLHLCHVEPAFLGHSFRIQPVFRFPSFSLRTPGLRHNNDWGVRRISVQRRSRHLYVGNARTAELKDGSVGGERALAAHYEVLIEKIELF